MQHIEIKLQDQAFIKLITSRDIENELHEFFSFRIPDFQFNPKVKYGLWDGRIRLFNLKDKTIYRGLLTDVIRFCEDREYAYHIEEDVKSALDFKLVDYICDNLIDGKTIREDQRRAVMYALESDRSIVVSPTASGKSLIIYIISLFYLLNDQRRVLIIVPTTSLVEQMYGDFIDYHNGDKELFAKTFKRIYAAYEKTIDDDIQIVCSTWHSIYNYPPEWFEQFDVIIGDEAHTFKAASLASIMCKSVNARYRHGVTATLSNKDSKVHVLVLQGLFGKPYEVSTTKELIDKGILSKIEINMIRFIYKDSVFHTIIRDLKKKKKLTFQNEIKIVSSLGARNRFILGLVLGLKGNSLVMFSLTDAQGKKIYEYLIDKAKEYNKKIFYIDGSTPTKDREAVRKIAEEENDIIIVCSFKTFATGVNIKNLHNIVMHTAYKSHTIIKQTLGRGLRLHESKDKVRIFDFGDDFGVKDFVNILFSQFKERLKLYRSEKHPIIFYEYEIEQERITRKNVKR